MKRAKKQPAHERYELDQSPLAQRPTQRDVAGLLGESRDDLRRLIDYKNQFIVRRTEVLGGKERQLAYPVNRLRVVHEKMKFHLNKVRQPSYLFSPRKNRGQRDNAAVHLDQYQFLTLDLKQFYPSTTEAMIYKWFSVELGMYPDVAGMLTHLCTVDGKASFGSPLTPVLCTLVHRPMFDRIAEVCNSRGLRYSLWVDDLTISGNFVPGQVVEEIRGIISAAGLRSHKVEFRTGNKPVMITGIGVVGRNLCAPNTLHRRIEGLWREIHLAETDDEVEDLTQRLLSQLGGLRYIVGPSSPAGQRAADQMNMLRQKRSKMMANRSARIIASAIPDSTSTDIHDIPF